MFVPLSFPIGIISVLLRLSLRPDSCLNFLNIDIDVVIKFMSARNRVVPSAIKLIFISMSPNFIPFIFLFCLMLIAKISATSKKSIAEIGQPCLIDLESLKKGENKPLFPTHE